MAEEFALLSEDEQQEILAELDPDIVDQMSRGFWWWTARPEQIPPETDWNLFLYLAGRGAGKSKSGSEWLVQRTIDHPYDTSGFPSERLVMAYSLSDARMVCIEGPSGILRALHIRGFQEAKDHYKGPLEFRYSYIKSPKPHITLLETGARIFFTGSEIDAARGLNLADVWLDEICKWDNSFQVWREGIRPALRADIPNEKPRAFVTTTPKPIALLRYWLDQFNKGEGNISVVRGSTFDNRINLSEDFLHDITKMYDGTALGRQELYGSVQIGRASCRERV